MDRSIDVYNMFNTTYDHKETQELIDYSKITEINEK